MKTLISFLLLRFFSGQITTADSPVTVNIGFIMDLATPVGRASSAAVSLARSDFYFSNPNSPAQILLHPRNSPCSDAVAAASAALDLISNHDVSAIIGPQSSASAAFVTQMGYRARIPVVSFTATSASLSASQSPFFIRAIPSDIAIVPAIAALASFFSWHRLVPIYEDSDFGASLIPALVDALYASGDSRIPYRCGISPTASDDRISMELYRLKTLQTRVFVLHASTALAVRILSAAGEAGMTESGYAWILTSAIAGMLGSINPVTILDSMQGAIGIRPFINRTNRVREFEKRWITEYINQNPNHAADIAGGDLSPFVYYAYDTFWAVATAVNAVIATARSDIIVTSNPSSNQSFAEMSKIRVSKIGPRLLKSIRETEFDGIAGRFQLVNGELNSSAFQIVNVKGESGSGIGFWTPAKGLFPKGSFGAVIWPGETMEVPKGWETPSGGKKMRFLVPGPVDHGFQSFLRVIREPASGKLNVGGYVIEVFEAAVRRLPYALLFEYVILSEEERKHNTTYDDLVKAVFDKPKMLLEACCSSGKVWGSSGKEDSRKQRRKGGWRRKKKGKS